MSNAPVPPAGPGGAPAPRPDDISDVAAGRRELDAIDATIRDLLARRIAVSKQVQGLRREHGIPGIQYNRENEIIAGYVDQLGAPGADIAMAILQLCRGKRG
jgi:chorismate mutase